MKVFGSSDGLSINLIPVRCNMFSLNNRTCALEAWYWRIARKSWGSENENLAAVVSFRRLLPMKRLVVRVADH